MIVRMNDISNFWISNESLRTVFRVFSYLSEVWFYLGVAIFLVYFMRQFIACWSSGMGKRKI